MMGEAFRLQRYIKVASNHLIKNFIVNAAYSIRLVDHVGYEYGSKY